MCDAAGIGQAVGGCLQRVMAGVAGARAPWTPPTWGLYPLDLSDGMRVAAGVETAAPVPGTRSRGVAGGPAAVTVHTGPYAELSLAYHALFAWIHERGLRPLEPAQEAYLVTPGEAGPEELVTRVVVPVDPAGLPDHPEGEER
jgi:hypothetical protein